ncbi:MAG: translation initiation factor [Myxococcota bacterium]
MGREVQGRRGRGVTTISGLPLASDRLRDLASDLKRLCGSGGTIRVGVIEIQGDHRDVIAAWLEGRGFQVERAGA